MWIFLFKEPGDLSLNREILRSWRKFNQQDISLLVQVVFWSVDLLSSFQAFAIYLILNSGIHSPLFKKQVILWRFEGMRILWKLMFRIYKWDKVFKNAPCKICGRQPLKTLKEYGLLKADHIPSNFLKAVFHKFYLVHSWILCSKYTCPTTPPIPWWKQLTLMFLNITYFLRSIKQVFFTWQAKKLTLLTFNDFHSMWSFQNDASYWKESVYSLDEISATLLSPCIVVVAHSRFHFANILKFFLLNKL